MSTSLVQTEAARVFAEVVFHIRISRYAFVAGMAIWAYDIFLTVTDEMTLLWARGGTLIKILYLINRYLPIVAVIINAIEANAQGRGPISVYDCKVRFALIAITQIMGIVIATSIFAFRMYTIYHGHRMVQRLLVALAICSHITTLVCLILLIAQVDGAMIYSDTLQLCIGSAPPVAGGVFVTPIFLESVIAFATLAHFVRFRRHQRDMQQASTAMNIMNALYVDGVMYFMIVLCLRLGSCVSFWAAPPTLARLACSMDYFVTSTVTSRWFLSFRRVLLHSLSPYPFTLGSVDRMTGEVIEFSPADQSVIKGELNPRQWSRRVVDDDAEVASYAETKNSPKTQSLYADIPLEDT